MKPDTARPVEPPDPNDGIDWNAQRLISEQQGELNEARGTIARLREALKTAARLRSEMRPHDGRAVMQLGDALDEAIALALAPQPDIAAHMEPTEADPGFTTAPSASKGQSIGRDIAAGAPTE